MGRPPTTLHFMEVGAYAEKKDAQVVAIHEVWISYDEMKDGIKPRIRFASDKDGTPFGKDTEFDKHQGAQKLDQIDFLNQLKARWASFCDATGNNWKSKMAQAGRQARLEALRVEWLESNDADYEDKVSKSDQAGKGEGMDTDSSSQAMQQQPPPPTVFPRTRIMLLDGHIFRRDYQQLSRSPDKIISAFLQGHIDPFVIIEGTCTAALWILESAFFHQGFRIDLEATRAAYYELKANPNLKSIVQTNAWNDHLPYDIEQREDNQITRSILSGESWREAKADNERQKLATPSSSISKPASNAASYASAQCASCEKKALSRKRKFHDEDS